jgi:hypothetical protein
MNSIFDLKSLTSTLGKNSASSLLSLVHTSRDELGRYAKAIEFGLREGKKGLQKHDDLAFQQVGEWFSEVESALKEVRAKIHSADFNHFAQRLEQEAKARPWFSISAKLILQSFLTQIRDQDTGSSRRKNAKLSARQ